MNRLNLTMEENFEIINIKYQESKTQFWSVPGRAYKIIEIHEVLPHFITVDIYNPLMKTNMTLCSRKVMTALKFHEKLFW